MSIIYLKKNHRSKKSRTNFHISYFNSNFSLSLPVTVCVLINQLARKALDLFNQEPTRNLPLWNSNDTEPLFE